LDVKNNAVLKNGSLVWPLRYLMTSVSGSHFKIISDLNRKELQA